MIEKILNLTEEELINKLLEKDKDGSYKDLIDRELKIQGDLRTFWHMMEDMVYLFDFGLKVSAYATGFCRITFYPTNTTLYFNYLDDNDGKIKIPVKDHILHVYKQMKAKIRIEFLDLIKYIRDNKYNFITSYWDNNVNNDYSIELYTTDNYGQNPKNEIRIHMDRDIKDIEGFKKLIDGIAERGYAYLTSLWYSDEKLLDTHRFCYERWELYSLSIKQESYYLFDIYNSRAVNAKHHYIITGHNYGTPMYEKVIEDKELLKQLLEITKRIE